MPNANSGTKFTHMSNLQLGSSSGGGGFKRGIVNVTDAATYTVLDYDSGKLHVLPDLSADITITLPTPAYGLEYEFIYGGAASDAHDWLIDTGSDTNYFIGGVTHLDDDAGSAADEVVPVYSDGNSNSKLTVLTPDCGTSVKIFCDGTNWYLNGIVVASTAPSLADQ